MAQPDMRTPSSLVASHMPHARIETSSHPRPSWLGQRRIEFRYDLRYLERVAWDHLEDHRAEHQRQEALKPDSPCAQHVESTPEIVSGGNPSIIHSHQVETEQPDAAHAGVPHLSTEDIPAQSEAAGTQIPVIPSSVATPCILSVPGETSSQYATYHSAPPRIEVPAAYPTSAAVVNQADAGSQRPEDFIDTDVPSITIRHRKLSMHTPIGGVPECHQSAMRSTPEPPNSPSPPPTPIEGVPELHASAFAPVLPHRALAPALRSPTPSTAPGSPPSALEGVPEAHDSAWAPCHRPIMPTAIPPPPALHADSSNGDEASNASESPVLARRNSSTPAVSHSFHVPDHPVLLHSNPSPLPLTPRSQLIAESQQHPSPAPSPIRLAPALPPEAAAAAGALDAGPAPSTPLDYAPESPPAELHVGIRRVHVATSMTPGAHMLGIEPPPSLAPLGHASVAVGTTPLDQGGIGAHTLAGAGARAALAVPHVEERQPDHSQPQQQPEARSDASRGTRVQRQLPQQTEQSVPAQAPARAGTSRAAPWSGLSWAGAGVSGAGKDAATDTRECGLGDAGAGGQPMHSPAPPPHGASMHAEEQQHADDMWFGADGDGAMGGVYSDTDIPEDPFASPRSARRVGGAGAHAAEQPNSGPAPPDLAMGGRSVSNFDRVTPRLPGAPSVNDAGSAFNRQRSGQMSTGGLLAAADMLGWGGAEMAMRDHAMPDPRANDGGGFGSDVENVPSNSPPEQTAVGEQPEQALGKRTRKRAAKELINLQKTYGKRKSLAEDGLAEKDGRRYSTRKRLKPIRWFVGEKKTYVRNHASLPTVAGVERTDQRSSAYAGWKAGHRLAELKTGSPQ
eukprot:jgi/Ulvmu1/5946/UM026_0068.1